MSKQTPSEEIVWEQRKFPLIVIAENIHSPSNVGLIIRACESFGVDRLYFAGFYSNVDTEKFRKTARAAQKYIEIIIQEDTISLLQTLRIQHYKSIAIEIGEASKSLADYTVNNNEKIALIIGSERHGINEISLKLADEYLHIQQFGKTGSLNVGMALSIALYEITKQLL